jgi:xanthine dehydrogenase YagR molybdenum-binding subunit
VGIAIVNLGCPQDCPDKVGMVAFFRLLRGKLKAGLAAGMTEAEGSVTPAELSASYSHAGFGAHFVEVAVHRDTGEVRVRRMLGVFAAGRILNSKTARSQMIGGMTWGIGSALMEESTVDQRCGSFIAQDGELPRRGQC